MVLGKPGLVPAEEIDEAPQVEALIGNAGTVALPEMRDVAKVEEVELAGLSGEETFLGPVRQRACQPLRQRHAEPLLLSLDDGRRQKVGHGLLQDLLGVAVGNLR